MEKFIRKDVEYKEDICGLNEALFHNANGYIGVRGCLEEGVPEDWDTMRGMYINGFYDIIPMKQAEKLYNFVEKKQIMLNVADTQTIFLTIDGERFSLAEGTVLENVQTLNMGKGITNREILWRSNKGNEIKIHIKRMTSFMLVSLFTIEYSVTPLNFSGKVQFDSYHISDVSNYSNPNDPRLAVESENYLTPKKVVILDEGSLVVSKTSVSNLSACVTVAHRLKALKEAESISRKEGNTVIYQTSVHAEEGEKVTLEKYSVFADSIRGKDVEERATNDLKNAVEKGVDYFYLEQEKYLNHFWHQSELEIKGDLGMNQAVHFNIYQLLQSVAKDSHCNIAAKGLSGEGYEGHYFWDTEMYMLPFFTLTNPSLAKKLMSYRYDTLDAAKENAKLLGHKKGALYPWRTITGEECSGYFPSGTAQYHIDGDIAYAIVNYYLTTGDLDFIMEKGQEILIETARLWLDVGNYSEDKFVINNVTGPDEYTCIVNNNYYTNCCAKYNLNWAVKFYEILKNENKLQKLEEKIEITEKEILEMKNAADKMLLLYDEKLGINPQDDSFLNKTIWNLKETPKDKFPLLLHYHPLYLYRHQVCKQADTVLAYFLFENEQSKEVMKRSYEYYEKITTHDSSLSTCVFSIMASRLGMQEKSYDYFGDSAKLDLENTHNNTKHGIHTANMGGCYMAIVNGFAGLRIDELGISIAPFLPKDWKEYNFKIRYYGSLLRISVMSEEVIVELEEGKDVELKIFKENYLIEKERTTAVSY